MSRRHPDEAALASCVQVLIVGAGQAGLAAAHELGRAGIEARVVDGARRIGDSWRRRWDSLHLFTPATANGLPGAPMRGDAHFPSKDDAADYLEAYAATHGIPIALGHTATRTERCAEGGFNVTVGNTRVRTEHLIAATGAHRVPTVPAVAPDLSPDVAQYTSADYRRPGALPAGPVLVVGAANSGAEIALDLATAGRTVTLAGRDVGRIPRLGAGVFRAMRLVRTTRGPGRLLARLATRAGGDPLGRLDPSDLDHAGIVRAGRVTHLVDGQPATADGPLTGYATVVWCTGLRPDLSWLAPAVDLPAGGIPVHRRGAVVGEPRLHLLGQPYQRSMASHLMGGVGDDAAETARRVARALSRSSARTRHASETSDRSERRSVI